MTCATDEDGRGDVDRFHQHLPAVGKGRGAMDSDLPDGAAQLSRVAGPCADDGVVLA